MQLALAAGIPGPELRGAAWKGLLVRGVRASRHERPNSAAGSCPVGSRVTASKILRLMVVQGRGALLQSVHSLIPNRSLRAGASSTEPGVIVRPYALNSISGKSSESGAHPGTAGAEDAANSARFGRRAACRVTPAGQWILTRWTFPPGVSVSGPRPPSGGPCHTASSDHVRRDSANATVRERLKHADDEPELVIVKDMMLAGYDSPAAA